MPRKEPAEVPTAPHDAPSVGTSVFPQLPPFTPRTAATWFAFAETYFAAARISDPTVKLATVLTRFSERERERVEDILTGPMLDYEKFKSEILQRFAESDNLRIQRLLQFEEIGDRTPSEFYRHLRELATPDVSEKMVLTLWKTRLPPSVQHVLATVMDFDAATQMRVADSVYELRQTSGRFAAEDSGQVAAATPIPTTTTCYQQNLSSNVRHDGLADQVEALFRAWSLGEGRRPERRFPAHRRRRPPSRRPDPNPGKTACVSTTQDSANGRLGASNLARDGRTRETRAAICRRGVRRRLQFPPHIHNGQEDEDLLPRGHGR
jgi:hypothetical protein